MKTIKDIEDMSFETWITRLGLGRIIIAAILFGLWTVSSCTYDKGEVIAPVSLVHCDSIKAIDPLTVTYTCDVLPIISTNCTATCHKAATPGGAPSNLDTYDLVVNAVNALDLVCAIDWSTPCNTLAMPQPFGADPVDSLDIVTIKEWVVQNMPQ